MDNETWEVVCKSSTVLRAFTTLVPRVKSASLKIRGDPGRLDIGYLVTNHPEIERLEVRGEDPFLFKIDATIEEMVPFSMDNGSGKNLKVYIQ